MTLTWPICDVISHRKSKQNAKTRILVVDDEEHIRDVVHYALTQEEFLVETANDGREALERVRDGGIDLVVLAILMPDLDGLNFCRIVRKHQQQLPIIFLSSRGEEFDRILGLELGGDDYLAKPFSPRELTTRVKTVLRRGNLRSDNNPPRTIRHGDLEIDLSRLEAHVGGEKLDFTLTEFRVLYILLERPGRVLTRSQLIQQCYEHDNHITERTIDTHIRRIRAKLRPFGISPVETVHGLGYKASG